MSFVEGVRQRRVISAGQPGIKRKMIMKKQKISDAVIHRLPRYYRYLDDLYNKGVVRISSSSLGSKMDITASQIRQDLSCFGEFCLLYTS